MLGGRTTRSTAASLTAVLVTVLLVTLGGGAAHASSGRVTVGSGTPTAGPGHGPSRTPQLEGVVPQADPQAHLDLTTALPALAAPAATSAVRPVPAATWSPTDARVVRPVGRAPPAR
jgi:hypothetical protein